MDFECCGSAANFFAQAGESTAGGGLPDNAWQWNPGMGFGQGPHFPFRDDGRQTGANHLLFGEPSDCVPPCIISFCGDLNGDGTSDGDDFFLYLDLFESGDPCADIDEDGDIDADDFFGYLDLFVVRC